VAALREWKRWGVWVFALGGALWVLKVTLITANHLLGRDVDASGVPVLYVAAVTLLALGATAVGAALARRRPWWAQLLAAACAIPTLILVYSVVDAVLKGIFGDAGPSWLADELGIVATGALCLAAGVLLGRTVGWPGRSAREARPA
jgi:TRAP-type uncharacterized transport system fused permease subunit